MRRLASASVAIAMVLWGAWLLWAEYLVWSAGVSIQWILVIGAVMSITIGLQRLLTFVK